MGIINPVPQWDGNTWYAGHFYSQRDPVGAGPYDPKVNGRPHLGWDLAAAEVLQLQQSFRE